MDKYQDQARTALRKVMAVRPCAVCGFYANPSDCPGNFTSAECPSQKES